METATSARMIVLIERLRSIDKSQARLTAERLKVLSEIAELDAENGASARQTASRVARATSSTPAQAASEVATAKQVAALPGIADAHAKGEITNGQLGAVAAIASASSEEEALALAKTATSSQLHKRAAASKGKSFDERRNAHSSRYLAFKPEEDGQATRIHGRLPFAEASELETQLRKIADRIGLCSKDRPSPSARMADALLILTKHNPSQALHHAEAQANAQPNSARPAPSTRSTQTSESVRSTQTAEPATVQRADTRIIIHWNAQTGEVNYENGPAIDHPRLMVLLCDAQIDIQHCDPSGLPTGLVTSAYHASWRQDRYLAYRDGPCRIPECQGIGKTQAHHIFEDRADRVTSVQYMINLCNRCHQEHHDGTFTITGNPEHIVTFTYKDKTILTSNAKPLPITLKQPKPLPLAKHQPDHDANLFATSA